MALLLWCLTLTLLSGCLSTSQPHDPSRSKEIKKEVNQILCRGKILTHEYVAFLNGNEVEINFRKNSKPTKEQLLTLRRDMKSILPEVKGENKLPVTITAWHPLAFDEFELVVKTYQIHVTGYYMRSIENQKDRVTTLGVPEDGHLIPKHIEQLKEQGAWKGVIAIYGEIPNDPDNFSRLMNDPRIFVADITGAYAKKQVQKSEAYKKAKTKGIVHIDVNVPNQFWHLEDLKMVK